VQQYVMQAPPAPVVAAPVTVQAIHAAPMIAVQPAPVVAAPVQQVVAAPITIQPAPVVAAPVQQVVAAPMTVQLTPAPQTCGPQRLTQETDLEAAAACLQRARSILANQPSSLTDDDLRGMKTKIDKIEKLLSVHDDWIQQKRAAEKK
jgi:hypothetical protein